MKNLHILLFVLMAYFSQAQNNWELLPPHNSNIPVPVKIKSALKYGISVEENRNCKQLFDPNLWTWADLNNNSGDIHDIGIFSSGKWIAEIDYKIFVSTDSGMTWDLMQNFPHQSGSSKIMLTNENMLFVGVHGKFFTSSDEGNSWVETVAPGFSMYGWFFDQFQKIYISPEALIYNDIYHIQRYTTETQTVSKVMKEESKITNNPNSSFMD